MDWASLSYPQFHGGLARLSLNSVFKIIRFILANFKNVYNCYRNSKISNSPCVVDVKQYTTCISS